MGILMSTAHVTYSMTVAAITQLVECLAVNQIVTGSSPVGGVSNKNTSGNQYEIQDRKGRTY